jgi:hypothetical protein
MLISTAGPSQVLMPPDLCVTHTRIRPRCIDALSVLLFFFESCVARNTNTPSLANAISVSRVHRLPTYVQRTACSNASRATTASTHTLIAALPTTHNVHAVMLHAIARGIGFDVAEARAFQDNLVAPDSSFHRGDPLSDSYFRLFRYSDEDKHATNTFATSNTKTTGALPGKSYRRRCFGQAHSDVGVVTVAPIGQVRAHTRTHTHTHTHRSIEVFSRKLCHDLIAQRV